MSTATTMGVDAVHHATRHVAAALEKGNQTSCRRAFLPFCRPPAAVGAKERNIADEEANGSEDGSDAFAWTEEEETRIRRKLDRIIVPLTTLLYLLCFLDR